jgi:glycosyltransferase involved in cell wall biosynthesis
MVALPHIDIIVIGLNSARTLGDCLKSITSCRYPQENIRIFYADGGSIDESCAIARLMGCNCLRVEDVPPTPGRQRNAGWRCGSAEYVQFIDSDTLLDPDWLSKAVLPFALTPKVGAVCGNRRELHPDETPFNWIGNLEWKGPPGEAQAFGGDALIPRAVLETTGGYDDALIAGEDPELSYRIRQVGLKIIRLDEPMTEHDLAMRGLGQYWRRSFRSGHAYAEVHSRHRDLWGEEVRRIALRALPFLIGLVALPFAVLSPWAAFVFLAVTAILLRPRLVLVEKFRKLFSLTKPEARTYAWHASLVVIPQFFGMFRFYIGRLLSRPLENRRILPKAAQGALE